eukprot:scaffold23055_cov56-Skeletonema_dohrnii-CCMP3373.AAC.1
MSPSLQTVVAKSCSYLSRVSGNDTPSPRSMRQALNKEEGHRTSVPDSQNVYVGINSSLV